MTGQRHNICITRGETFTIDKLIVNKDGSPYVVSNALKNPHFLLKIAQSKYAQNGRQTLHIWLPVADTFYCTNVVTLDSPDRAPELQNAFIKDYFNTRKTNDYAVYKFNTPKDANGNDYSAYYQWYGVGINYKEYNTRFSYTFTSDLTSKLIEQDYVYSIDLVAGDSTEEYVNELADKIYAIPPEYSSVNFTLQDKLYFIKLYDYNNKTNYADGIVLDKKLHNITFSVPILSNCSILVNN